MNILEVGFKLNNTLDYYNKLLKSHNINNVFSVETRDIYWTNKDLNNLSENEIKNNCIRLRMGRKLTKGLFKGNWSYKFQNYNIFDNTVSDSFDVVYKDLDKYINNLESNGFKKVFDTYKKDYHYSNDNMKSRIQLQVIKEVGLVLYYDNPDYYELPLKEQRNMLIKELNSYGFNFSNEELGIDKLRTLYYKKECYSENQNA